MAKKSRRKGKKVKADSKTKSTIKEGQTRCSICKKGVNKNDTLHKQLCEVMAFYRTIGKPVEPVFFNDFARHADIEQLLEMLRMVDPKRKAQPFLPNEPMTLVDTFIACRSPLAIFKELFSNISFDVLLEDNPRSVVMGMTMNRIQGLIPLIPDFPLDVFEYMLENIPIEKKLFLKKSLVNLSSNYPIGYISAALKDFVVGEHLTFEEYVSIMWGAIYNNAGNRNEIVLMMWDRLTLEQKMTRFEALKEHDHPALKHLPSDFPPQATHDTLLTKLIEASMPLAIATFEALVKDMPLEFGSVLLKPSGLLVEMDVNAATLNGEVKRFLNSHFSYEPLEYELEAPLHIEQYKSATNEVWWNHLDSLPRRGIWCGTYSPHLTSLFGDFDFYAPRIANVLSNMEHNPLFVEKSSLPFQSVLALYEMVSLVYQGDRRKEILEFAFKEYAFKIPYNFATLEMFANITCGFCNPEIIRIIGRLVSGTSFPRVKRIFANDEKLLAACNNFMQIQKVKTDPQFFSKKYRLKCFTEKAEKLKEQGDLIGALDLWWNCLLIDVHESSKLMKHYTIEFWAKMASDFQKKEDYKTAIRCCNIGLLFNRNNPDRFVLLFACGKLYRLMRDAFSSENYFTMAAIVKPDLAQCHFEKGVSQNVLGNYNGAVDSLLMCLKLDPNHDFANQAVKKIIREAANAEDLMMEASVKRLFIEKSEEKVEYGVENLELND